jgi:hypothetical protein
MRPRAPRQSEYIVALPLRPGDTVLTASRSRWTAINPRSAPKYALAAADASANATTSWPRPLVHSSTKAAAHGVMLLNVELVGHRH